MNDEAEEVAPESAPETVKQARVAQYGLLGPIEGRELVVHQMRAGARYYNDLIALERCRRGVYRDLRREHVDMEAIEGRVVTLAAELEAQRTAIKDLRKQARGRVATAELDAQAKLTHGALKVAREELKVARIAAREDVHLKAAVSELDERAKVWAKAMRATTDAYWGTYLLVEASIEQARKSVVDPTFRRAHGRERRNRTGEGPAEGRIGVQIQGGMSVAELLGGEDTRLRLTDAPLWLRRGRTSARGLRRCATKLLHIRVGSEGRAPVWAVFPLILHRDIPDGAVIKGATIALRVVAHREQWTVAITYTREAVPMPQHSGIVAIDLGWRKRPDAGLRVAYWVDDQGGHGEVVMPVKIRDRLTKARDLQEIQDRHFNRATRWLTRWLAAVEDDAIPDWLRHERATLGQWRSHERLRRLVLRWRAERFPGDTTIYAALERWMHRSRHLYQWQESTRHKALLARREVYRIVAARMAKTYGTVILEQFNLATAKRLVQPEQGENAPQAQRAQLHASAPGEFRQVLTQAVQRDGGLVASVSAIGTTSHCHACGGVCSWDQGEELWHGCEHCGAVWDQDFNAATNLLRTFVREQAGEAAGPDHAPKPSKRSERFAKKTRKQG